MLVSELLNLLLVRFSGPPLCSLLEAVREVQGIISHRLILRQSELIKSLATLTVNAGETTVALPSDYISLAGRPYLSGERVLIPLDGRDVATVVNSELPKFYEIIGRTLYLYHPTTSAAMTVKLPYYQRPAIVTTMESPLPFFGEFDSVFVEGCTAVMSGGLAVVANREFVGVIQSQVDALLDSQRLIAEQLLVDAINEQ